MATNIMDKVVPADEMGEDVEVVKQDSSQEPEIISTEEIIIEPDETDSDKINQEIMEYAAGEDPEIEDSTEERTLDKDFYTKSMDLSTSDLEMSDDFQEKGLPVIVKILIAFLLLSIVAVAIYFIYLRLK